jgi:thiosulfate/3-mercaptopyruvate sulfurtransferase
MKKPVRMMFALLVLATGGAFFCGCTQKAGTPKPAEPASEATTEENASTEATSTIDARKVFVPADWVKSVVDGSEPQSGKAVIVQAGWGDTPADYKKAHIPGALWLNTDLIEEDKYWNIRSGEEITKVMNDFGITKDTPVIVYGADSGAARFAFVCLWAGVEEVHLLDGGWKSWESAGFPTENGESKAVASTDFGAIVPVYPEYVIAMPAEAQKIQKDDPNFMLVSIRSWDEFIGKTSGYNYIDRKGEPKGAVWGHDEADFYNADDLIKPLSEIQKGYWDEWSITSDKNIAFYCGTGWRATVPWLLTYENGWKNIRLYDGGWFVWQMDKANPVQTGDPRK